MVEAAESKVDRKIRKRQDQNLSEELLKLLNIPTNCSTCPRVAYEYRRLRNQATDNTFRAVSDEHTELQSSIEDFFSPTSAVEPADLQDLLVNYFKAIRNYQDNHPFISDFTDYLESVGTLDCNGVIEFKEQQLYLRRYTRDQQGNPKTGLANAVCAQDFQYIRDSKGFADFALQPMNPAGL